MLRVLAEVQERGLNVRQTEELVDRILQRRREAVEARRPKRTLILKDLRTFRNSVKSLADTLRKSGLRLQ